MDQYKSMFSYDCGPHKTKYKGESPRVVARKRWADAINQQLILIRMEKFNSQIKSKSPSPNFELKLMINIICIH